MHPAVILRILGLLLMVYSSTMLLPALVAIIYNDGGEKQFFRDPGQFRIVSDLILPDIRRRRGPGHTIRIWSAGCASGEEAYSLAMLLHRRGALSQASILGTDVSSSALQRARVAEYDETELSDEQSSMAGPFLIERGGRLHINASMKQSGLKRTEYQNKKEESLNSPVYVCA